MQRGTAQERWETREPDPIWKLREDRGDQLVPFFPLWCPGGGAAGEAAAAAAAAHVRESVAPTRREGARHPTVLLSPQARDPATRLAASVRLGREEEKKKTELPASREKHRRNQSEEDQRQQRKRKASQDFDTHTERREAEKTERREKKQPNKKTL